MKVKYRPITITCAAALAVGCASAPRQRTYVAPTQETIFTTTEEMTSAPGQVIYVENRSSVPVTVYSVTLRDCDNIKVGCSGPRVLHLQLTPDSRAVLARVEPANAQKSFNFRYTFGWRADSSTTAALGALATVGDSNARHQLDAIAREDAKRRAAVGAIDMDLTASEIAGLSDRAGKLHALPDSLVIPVGRRVSLDTVRVLLIGMQGKHLAAFARCSGVCPGRWRSLS